jgi:hypothetical protein
VEVLEYVLQVRGAEQSAAQVRGVADASVGLSGAQTKVGESADLAAAGTGRMEKAMAAATRVSRSGMLGLTETHHALSRVGSEASTMASRFGRAMATMRAEAMKPIRPIIEGARNVGGRVRGGVGMGGGIGLGGGLLAGGLVAYGAVRAVKASVESTSQMVIQATAMNKVMGMNTNTALQWVAVAQAHGIASRQLSMGFKTLGTQVEHATAGTKASVTAFKTLGITHAQLAAHSHDLSGMLGLVADQLNKMPGGATKTAIAAQLLGRSYVGLIPILAEGSKGMAEQRKQAAAYGITLGGNPLQNLQKLHEASINLKIAQTGLEFQLAEHVAPAMIKVFNAGLVVYGVLKKSLTPAIHALVTAVKDSVGWFHRHETIAFALGSALASILLVMAGFKILRGITTAWIALDTAMAANPFGLIVIAIAGISAALVVLLGHIHGFSWGGLKADFAEVIIWIDGKLNSLITAYNDTVGSIPFGPGKIGLINLAGVAVSGGLVNAAGGGFAKPRMLTPSQQLAASGSGIGRLTPKQQRAATAPIHPTGAQLPHAGRNFLTQRTLAPANGFTIQATFSHPIVVDGREIARVNRRETIKAMAAGA